MRGLIVHEDARPVRAVEEGHRKIVIQHARRVDLVDSDGICVGIALHGAVPDGHVQERARESGLNQNGVTASGVIQFRGVWSSTLQNQWDAKRQRQCRAEIVRA